MHHDSEELLGISLIEEDAKTYYNINIIIINYCQKRTDMSYSLYGAT